MMPRRRRTDTDQNSRKRIKLSNARLTSEELPDQIDPSSQESLYEVKDILAESRTKFLIDWADDKRTGRKYPKSWVSSLLWL